MRSAVSGPILCCLLLGFSAARADSISDTLAITLNGNIVPFSQIPRLDIIQLTDEEEKMGDAIHAHVLGHVFDMRALELEAGRFQAVISDRLVIKPYTITVKSDAETPLAPRPGAIAIRGENFDLVIRAKSDSKELVRRGFCQSDCLDVVINGKLLLFRSRLTEDDELLGNVIQGTLPPLSFDITDGESNGVALVSEYVDFSAISFSFMSDGDFPGGLVPIVAPPGYFHDQVIASLEGARYKISLTSDGDVPEPSSTVLTGLGVLGFLGYRWYARRTRPLTYLDGQRSTH
jgi:hypothetical protein